MDQVEAAAPAGMARLKHLVCRCLVNAGLFCLALGVTVIGFGFVLKLIDGVPLFEFKNYARDYIDQFNRVRTAMYDERLGWRTKPNLHLSSPINGVVKTETTDAYGLRLHGGATSGFATGGILAVGDSFTHGADVGDDEAWPAYLQDMVGIPVANAATRGWGTDQIVMRAEDMLDVVHPRALIVGIYPPDIQRSELEIAFGSYKPYYTVDGEDLVLHGVPVPYLSASVHDLGWEAAILGYSYVAFWIARRLERWSTFGHFKPVTAPGTGEKVTCLLLKRLRQRLAAQRIRPILAMVYGNFDFAGGRQRDRALNVLGCAREQGYETVDTWAIFEKIFAADRRAFDSLYVFPDRWSHMSGAGNKLVAEAIAEQLQSNGGSH